MDFLDMIVFFSSRHLTDTNKQGGMDALTQIPSHFALSRAVHGHQKPGDGLDIKEFPWNGLLIKNVDEEGYLLL